MARYIHYTTRPKQLTAPYAKKQYQKLLEQLPAADESPSAAAWIKLYAQWNELKSYIGSEAARIYYAYSKNMADKTIEVQEKYLREKVGPVCDEPEFLLTKAFLATKHRRALAKEYGGQLVDDYETALKPLDPINTKLGIKASQLTKKYEKKIAAATVNVRGEKMTLSKVRGLLESDDRSLRHEAFLASRGWFLENHAQLADIYEKLVKIRHQMASNVGFDSFTKLAYKNMGRTEYDASDAETFRKNVYRYFVPLYAKITEQQRRDLDLKSLKPWDEPFEPSTSLPLGICPVDQQLDNAQELFDKLSPTLGKHFMQMRRNNLIDLENRLNKRAGAFCTTFSDEAKAAVLCNSIGDAEDIRTLTHEMGHAFQGLESMHIKTVDLQHGTIELAEVYSLGMEFLSLKYIDEFFDDTNSSKFRKSRWVRAIKLVCYVCVVDEFQHWVYDNPSKRTDERDKKWCELSDKYLPGIDFAGVKKYQKTRWYAQGHIFSVPFYYIDYALAESVAMQLGMLADKSHDKAIKKYLKLCKLGGTTSFLKALAQADLKSPFQASVIKELGQYAEKQLF